MRSSVLLFVAIASCAITACTADAKPERATTDEADLTGDVIYIRAVAEAAGPTFSLAETPFAGASQEVAFATLPPSLQARLSREVKKNTFDGDPERAGRRAGIVSTHEIRRDGRLVGRVAELGLAENTQSEDEPEFTFGSWLYFTTRNQLVAEVEWVL